MLTDAVAMPMLCDLEMHLVCDQAICGDAFAQAVGDNGRLSQIGFRQQDGEFLAAQPANDIRFPFALRWHRGVFFLGGPTVSNVRPS